MSVFADALTRDLQRSEQRSSHLHVDYLPSQVSRRRPPHELATTTSTACEQQMANNNCGFWRRPRFFPNIGYLKFNMGSGPPRHLRPTASAAMNLLAHTEGADHRPARERRRQIPRWLTSSCPLPLRYARTQSTTSTTAATTRRRSTTGTLPWVPGESGSRMQPVYVLTSHGTFSGAEEFTYDLKNLEARHNRRRDDRRRCASGSGDAHRRALRYRGPRRAAHQPAY